MTITRVTPSSGDTVTIPDGVGDVTLVVAPAADLATMTLAWPSAPFNGQVIRILFTKAITALSHSGGSLNRSIPAVPISGDMTFVYDAGGSTYMCSGVTLSPIVSLAFTASTAGGAGNAVFYATDSGLVGGTALFSSIQDVTTKFDVAEPNIAAAKAVVSNGNKTVTINCQKQAFNGITLLSTNILGSVTVGNAPNSVALTVLIHGILA